MVCVALYLSFIPSWTKTARTWGRCTFRHSHELQAGVSLHLPWIPFICIDCISVSQGLVFNPIASGGSKVVNVYAFNVLLEVRITDHLDVVACGDIPMVTTDNKVALRYLEAIPQGLITGESAHSYDGRSLPKDSKFRLRILSLVYIQSSLSLFKMIYFCMRSYNHATVFMKRCRDLRTHQVRELAQRSHASALQLLQRHTNWQSYRRTVKNLFGLLS